MNLRYLSVINNIAEPYEKQLLLLVEELKKKYENLDNSEYFVIQSGAKGKYFGLTNDYYQKSENWRIVVFIPQKDLYAVKIPNYITTFNKLYNHKLAKHNMAHIYMC